MYTAVDCGSLTVPNGQVSAPSGTTFMNTVTYTCDDGYNLNGASDRTCQASGNWDLEEPTCDRKYFCRKQQNLLFLLAVDCGLLNDTTNGAVDTSSGTAFMMTATYTCNLGYTLSSTDSRMCLASGLWSGEAPVCNCKAS